MTQALSNTQNFNIPTLSTLRNCTIIVGFSGGPDSVFLLTQLKNKQESHNLQIIAAHLDHEWRPESNNDALWCKNFCQNLNVSFVSKKSSQLNFSPKFNGSKEQLGRQQRRFFFQECLQTFRADHILLAHHRDDQIETFFFRLARGASIAGACGMKAQDGPYLRPLLHLSKSKILQFLHENHIEFLTDPTNASDHYLRSRMRKNLTPQLAAVDERFPEHITAFMQHLQKTDALLHKITLQTIAACTAEQGLCLKTFLNLDEILQQRIFLQLLIIKQITFTPSQAFFHEIMKFLHEGKQKKHQIGAQFYIIKSHGSFDFCKISSESL